MSSIIKKQDKSSVVSLSGGCVLLASSKLKKYNMINFNDVLIKGFEFELPSDTIKLIEEISKKVGAINYIKTPVFLKKENKEELNWDEIHKIKAPIPKNIIIEHTDINKIKTLLNKITDTTYDNYLVEIIECMKNADDIKQNEIGLLIFQIASNNRFYSKLYAKLTGNLINVLPNMVNIFNKVKSEFYLLFDNMENIDSQSNYELFCLMNKNNENRKSLSMFFVNLTKNNIMSENDIYVIIQYLICKLNVIIKNKENRTEVEELLENIFILYDKTFFSENEKLELLNYFNLLSNKNKNNDYMGLSNKSIFKIMDIIDDKKK
jgi:hypothetical protein